MKSPRNPRPKAPDGFFTQGEKRKVLIMAISSVVIVATLIASLLRDQGRDEAELAELPVDEPQMEERVVVPEIDTAAIEATVRDARAEDRAALEREGVVLLESIVRPLTRGHYEALGTRALDAAGIDEVLADPASARGQAFHARGWVRSHRPRTFDGQVEHHLRLTLEDDSTVYAVLLEAPADGFEPDVDFVRVDGLLLKAYADETDEGWVAGPLLVGRGAERSYPALPPLDEFDEVWLAGVEDFTLQNPASGLPFDPLWRMMAHARDLPDTFDWAAADELTPEAFGSLLTDGAPHRGQAFRIPISKLMGITAKRVGENPARLERITEGWIGNYTWPHLLHFRAPFVHEELGWGVYVEARGFFLKNFAYDSKTKDVQVAPVFVLHSLERFIPPTDKAMPQLMMGVAGFTVLSMLVLFYMLSRDRKRSEQLQQTLIERRRARRAQAEGGNA